MPFNMIHIGEEEIGYVVLLLIIVVAYIYLRKPYATITPPPKITNNIPKAPPKLNKKVVEIPSDAKAKIKVFFGSQTGTADDFSHILAKEALRHGIFAEVVDLESFNPSKLKDETLVIFVLATHGEGEPTDNAKEFYNWLGREEGKHPADHLSNLKYTIFGLGNKTYEQYNAVARFVDKRLQEFGATCIFERGEGDDDSSLEVDFNKWKKRVWDPVCNHLGIEPSDVTVDENFVPRFRLVTCPTSAALGPKAHLKGKAKTNTDGKPVHDIKNPYMARLAVNRELHSSLSDRSCRHIELEIGNHLTYQPGDHLGVYPENDTALVSNLAKRLNADLDTVVALVPTSQKNDDVAEAVLGPITLRQVFTDAIDITTPPRKAVLRALADYTTSSADKQQLLKLSSDAGLGEYNKFIKNDQRTIYEVLVAFPSVNPPLGIILELLPRLAARYYSISSSPNFHPGFVHITSVVVNFTTSAGRSHNGVCSTWLSQLPVGATIPIFVRESHFRIPSTPAPLVMIGPGTGLAPFRGFLQELSYRKANGANGWDATLFFGCRDRTHDFIYEEELLHFTQEGSLSHLKMAFSREQTNKVYVQNRMLENKQLIWDLIKDKNGYLYVCGDARQMAKAVQSALVNIVCECGKMNEQQANAFIEDIQKSGRYLQDVWF